MNSQNPQAPPAGVSARGAVDLAALAAAREQQRQAEERVKNGDPNPGNDLITDVTTAAFQTDVIDRSFQVPVVVDLWATWCGPCKQLSPLLEKLVRADAGKWVLAKVDVDAEPQIAQAFQVQSVPTVVAIIKGQPVPMFAGAVPEAQLRQVLDELIKVAAENGVSGQVGTQPEVSAEPTEDPLDSVFDDAAAAFERADWPAARTAFEAVLADRPQDPDALAGLRRVELMERIAGLDVEETLSAAADSNDATSVCAAADIDMSRGDERAAFSRLIAAVRATSGDERQQVREHLIALFTLLPADDPAVAKARTDLANALF